MEKSRYGLGYGRPGHIGDKGMDIPFDPDVKFNGRINKNPGDMTLEEYKEYFNK